MSVSALKGPPGVPFQPMTADKKRLVMVLFVVVTVTRSGRSAGVLA